MIRPQEGGEKQKSYGQVLWEQLYKRDEEKPQQERERKQ